MIAKSKKSPTQTTVEETYQFFQHEFFRLTDKFPDLMDCFEYFSRDKQMLMLSELERMAKNFMSIAPLLNATEKHRVKLSDEIEIMIVKRPDGAQVVMLTNNFEKLLKIDLVNGKISTTEIIQKDPKDKKDKNEGVGE